MIAIWIISAFIIIVASSWLFLPFFLKNLVNRKLSTIEGYHGSVKRVRVQLFRRNVVAEEVRIDKVDQHGLTAPFFSAIGVGAKLDLRKLISKQIFGMIVVERAKLELNRNYDSKIKEQNISSPFNLKTFLQQLLPFELDIFFKNSSLLYFDGSAKEPVEVNVRDINIQILHFSNQLSVDDSEVKIHANLYQGTFAMDMTLKPMAVKTTFDMNADIQNINMVLLNPYLRNHVQLDVNSGTFSMFTEVACSDGKFEGYIKPMITNLDVIGPQDKGDGLLRRVWEGLVAFTYQILKNKAHDQMASKIKIKGELDNAHINVISAVLSILKNGFIRGLTPSIDDVVSIDEVKKVVRKSKEWVGKIFQ